MPNRRMQQVEQRRAYAQSVRWRAYAVGRGWPQFIAGLGCLLLGLVITLYYYVQSRHGGVLVVMFGLIAFGLIQMVRGLGGVSAQKRLIAAQAPLTERQPWLLAPSAFAADGTAAEPGWLADPMGSGGLRFWDGQSWTEQTRSVPGFFGG